MMCKFQKAQNKEEIYYALVGCGLFPKKQKGSHKGTRDLLYIDNDILKESKIRWKNSAIAWTDYKKGLQYGPTRMDNRLS